MGVGAVGWEGEMLLAAYLLSECRCVAALSKACVALLLPHRSVVSRCRQSRRVLPLTPRHPTPPHTHTSLNQLRRRTTTAA
jgi:hypothetical protein